MHQKFVGLIPGHGSMPELWFQSPVSVRETASQCFSSSQIDKKTSSGEG